jgi:hypothetical protein
VAEVRNGVELFFNRTTHAADGWWWGSDEDPLQVGPFARAAEALEDARRGAERFKIVTWDETELRDGPDHFPATGHIIVIDTGGRLWTKTGERPARGDWKPKH